MKLHHLICTLSTPHWHFKTWRSDFATGADILQNPAASNACANADLTRSFGKSHSIPCSSKTVHPAGALCSRRRLIRTRRKTSADIVLNGDAPQSQPGTKRRAPIAKPSMLHDVRHKPEDFAHANSSFSIKLGWTSYAAIPLTRFTGRPKASMTTPNLIAS